MDTEIQVTALNIRPLMVPLRRPLATRVGLFEKGPFLALDLETKGGAGGALLGFTFSPLGLTIVPPVLEAMTERLRDKPISLATMPAIHDGLQRQFTLLGHEGVVQMALSMMDMLLYDALAREAGIPLYRLLGGSPEPIPTYNSCGLGIMDSEAAAKEAAELAAADGGYGHIKMRLGRETIDADFAALAAVRAAIGPDVALSVDFNQGLRSIDAIDACRRIDDLGLVWIEEPVVYDDYETQTRLARKLATPLQVGENWWSWRVGQSAIVQEACDLVMPDILRIGGVTGWMRLARVAEIHAIPFSSHLSPDYSAHIMAATPTAHWLEYMDWGQDLLAEPLVPEAGFVVPREVPGAGMAFNEAAVSKVVVSA